MAAEVHSSLSDFCERVLLRQGDLEAVLIGTCEGVPITKAVRKGSSVAIKLSQESELPQVFSSAADQAGKMGMGGLSSMVTFSDRYCLVYVNMMPLVVTFVHQAAANCGATLDIIPSLREALEPIRQQVDIIYGKDQH
ncbi:unnamed protein product [Chrysoparadoxa australica]